MIGVLQVFGSCNPSWLVMLLINISSHSDIFMIQDPMFQHYCLVSSLWVIWSCCMTPLYTHLSALDHPWWWHLTGVLKRWVLNYCNLLTCVHSNRSNANMTVCLVSAWTVIYISSWYFCACTYWIAVSYLLFLSFQFYCLPDNYEVIDSSLDDIKVKESYNQNCYFKDIDWAVKWLYLCFWESWQERVINLLYQVAFKMVVIRTEFALSLTCVI